MAKDRIISRDSHPLDAPVEAESSGVMRPSSLDDYIGQPELKERLTIALDAARQRSDPMEHTLLHGPPGLGKTTLAHIIANEMGTRAYVTSGPALTKGGDLVGTLTRMQPGDILFIDEIHRLPAAVEEYVYPAMEDFKIDFTLDSGIHAKVITYNLKPFTLIGATTRAGLLTGALRSRFGLSHRIDYYQQEELVDIVARALGRLGIEGVPTEAINEIARRSRGTPRIGLRLMRRVRDFAQVRHGGKLNPQVVMDALALEGVDDAGLDKLDRMYLSTLIRVYQGGPAGLEAIAATMGEDPGTLEDVVEPYLLQIGFMARTRQGRQITPEGRSWLESTKKSDSGSIGI
ncbi:MAG: Holliday junction branch migration DNA helicase RuvB [Phycisphaerales bacterium]|nr:Holliday junction branch migration DNA helicase RuvB [Phycisphaerales bacterium]|tara:strand:- start:17654 stop:18691 length:1038 start_codon:yes stop_codon:yes gene_type:complete